MSLSRELCRSAYNNRPVSLPDVGFHFQRKDHTTVLHAIRAVRRRNTLWPDRDGHDYDQLKLALLTWKAQKQLPEVWGYAQEAI